MEIGYCPKHKRSEGTDYERQRGSAAKRGYGRRWQKARLRFLRANPLCKSCDQAGQTVPATEVDHIKPHRGDAARFWDASNWQPLCKSCHTAKTNRENDSTNDRRG